jgi:3-deoxy-D-manno-octulosonic-acid transferase
VADIALVGGSLLDYEKVGGHNPLEPAVFATPTLVGPNMKNFPEITRLLKEGKALLQLTDSDELEEALNTLFREPAAARAMGERARAVLEANRGAVAKTVQSVGTKWACLQRPPSQAGRRRFWRNVAMGLSSGKPSLPLRP